MRYKDAPVKIPVNENDCLETRPAHYRQHRLGVWHRAGLLQETADMNDAQRAKVRKNHAMIDELMDREILDGLGLLRQGDPTGASSTASVSEGERDERIRNTYAMIDLIDQGVGRILDALRETGSIENTVIVFTTDHGELMGDHGVWLKGPFFYDGLINVPLVIRKPGEPERTVNSLASSIDIFPTCCELLGVAPPRACDGVSLVPAFTGASPRSECLVEYRNGYFENDINTMAYIDNRYKFVQYQNNEIELTDRIRDPEENVNLAFGGQNGELVAEYREKMLMMVLGTGNKVPDQISHA